jgi:hypothetical protein
MVPVAPDFWQTWHFLMFQLAFHHSPAYNYGAPPFTWWSDGRSSGVHWGSCTHWLRGIWRTTSEVNSVLTQCQKPSPIWSCPLGTVYILLFGVVCDWVYWKRMKKEGKPARGPVASFASLGWWSESDGAGGRRTGRSASQQNCHFQKSPPFLGELNHPFHTPFTIVELKQFSSTSIKKNEELV